MKRKLLLSLLILVILAGVAGAIVSVCMVISAVQFSEWGRVIVYSVTTAVCVEMILLSIGKLREKESA